jgi:hypothetical protein
MIAAIRDEKWVHIHRNFPVHCVLTPPATMTANERREKCAMGDELPERPVIDDREAWRAYWTAQGMPWRTEPAIDADRKAHLAGRWERDSTPRGSL